MEINGRKFIENNNYYIFDRTCGKNESDILNCAALAMHKAIIGICELDSLERSEKATGFNHRQSKAVITYYIIYHLFTCCMLMDKNYQIRFYTNKDNRVEYCVNLNDLKKRATTAQDWNDRKFLEADIATNISHSDIKKYCNRLRKTKRINDLPAFLIDLFNAFVKENPSLILFEKAAYIRDRSIYRPSHVPDTKGSDIQTSLDVRNQVDSLPKSTQLYDIACKIHYGICKNAKDAIFGCNYAFLFYATPVDCPNENEKLLNYTWDNLEKMGGNREKTSVPAFLAQTMELFSSDLALEYYEKYWKTLIENTSEIYKEDLNKSRSK